MLPKALCLIKRHNFVFQNFLGIKGFHLLNTLSKKHGCFSQSFLNIKGFYLLNILFGQMVYIPLPRFLSVKESRRPSALSTIDPTSQKKHDETHPISATVSEEMEAIRSLCEEYNKDDIYNMDETRLHWKHVPHTTLAPDTSHVTLMLCVNSTGSDRLPVWIMGSEKEPIYFQGLDPKMVGAVWLPTENQSMTHTVMQKWLLHFYSHIWNECSIILLLDNLLAHRKWVETTAPQSNIRIQRLPQEAPLVISLLT